MAAIRRQAGGVAIGNLLVGAGAGFFNDNVEEL